jgi:hypothetical protein
MYTYGCGYKTLNQGNSARHKKIKCGYETTVSPERFILEREYLEMLEETETPVIDEEIEKINYTTIETSALNEEREQNKQTISQLNNTIQNLRNSLEAMNGKVRRAVAKMPKSAYTDDIEDDLCDMIKDGIVYFITDKDVPDRGKIGRTVNTDIRKLKSRYSIFGNPDVLCYFSNDINAGENVLKKMMRNAGCMKTNTEIVSNVSLAREVFYEFIEMTI